MSKREGMHEDHVVQETKTVIKIKNHTEEMLYY